MYDTDALWIIVSAAIVGTRRNYSVCALQIRLCVACERSVKGGADFELGIHMQHPRRHVQNCYCGRTPQRRRKSSGCMRRLAWLAECSTQVATDFQFQIVAHATGTVTNRRNLHDSTTTNGYTTVAPVLSHAHQALGLFCPRSLLHLALQYLWSHHHLDMVPTIRYHESCSPYSSLHRPSMSSGVAE